MDEFDLSLEEKESPSSIQYKKELSRKSQDRIRVYNPTSEDYIVYWAKAQDGGGMRIPASGKDLGQGPGQAVLPRYIAKKYAEEMAKKIHEGELVIAVKNENAKRVKAGMAIMTPFQEEPTFASRITNNQKTGLPSLIRSLWLGVEEEYFTAQEEPEQSESLDRRTEYEKAIADLDRPAKHREAPVEAVEDPTTTEATTKSAKDALVEEISE